MNIKNNTLPSFSLVEIIIVMVVTSFLIIIIWLGFNFVVKNFISFQDTNEKYFDLFLFDNQFRDDFIKSDYIKLKNSKQIILLFKHKDNISYYFREDGVLRSQSLTNDFFEFKKINMDVRFLYSTQLVSGLGLKIELNNRLLNLYYTKEYNPYVLQNQQHR